MKHTKLTILLALYSMLTATSWAKFCSECGKPLPSETAKFCSECGASISGNTNLNSAKNEISNQDRVEKLFAPVDEFAIFLSSSNFLTCIAKYPEYKIKFNQNKKDIEQLLNECDPVTKKVIDNYYLYWNTLCNSIENYTKTRDYDAMGEEYRCRFLLSYINEVKSIWKSNGSIEEITKIEKIFTVATKVFTLCKSNFYRVPGGPEVIANGARFMLVDVTNDKAKIVILGGKNNCGIGWHSTVAGFTEKMPTQLWFPTVNRKELLKRTDCTEEDLNTFKTITKK